MDWGLLHQTRSQLLGGGVAVLLHAGSLKVRLCICLTLSSRKARAASPSLFVLGFQFQDVFFLSRRWSASPVSPGPSNENLYRKVWRREGQTLSVQCSYKNRRNLVEAKSWCKVRKKKCDHNFVRSWVRGPSYYMRDDAKAKVVRITMEALRVQDSGRYWCMRNTAGNFYPLVGFQLEVYPGESTCTAPE